MVARCPEHTRKWFFSTEGDTQREVDRKRIEQHSSYATNHVLTRTAAINYIKENSKLFFDFVTRDQAGEAAVKQALGLSDEDVQLLAFQDHIRSHSETTTWGTHLELAALCAVYDMIVQVYIVHSGDRDMKQHPSLATLGNQSAQFNVTLLHSERQDHFMIMLREEDADIAEVKGVWTDAVDGHRYVVLDVPGDGRCMYTAVVEALKFAGCQDGK